MQAEQPEPEQLVLVDEMAQVGAREALARGASAALVERAGGRVVVVPGSPQAMKVTTRADLLLLAALLDA